MELIPYRQYVKVDKTAPVPVFVQIAEQLSMSIQRGYLPNGLKLPGARKMAQLLGLHRNTLTAAYELLEAQGWVVSEPARGTFVRYKKPQKSALPYGKRISQFPEKPGFDFARSTLLDNPYGQGHAALRMDDGLPDVRLSHLDYLARLLRTNLKRRGIIAKLSGDNQATNLYYREQLANYLHMTRGLRLGFGHLLVTRSLELAIYVVAQSLLSPGDRVVVGDLSYFATNMILQKAGGRLLTVPVDGDGIDVDALERICRREPVRMLYLTPHYHYPTTVSLGMDRRLRLLELASRFGFVILEDDYDYDFHYGEGGPLLPLTAMDTAGMTVYVGSFGRSMPSAFRSGYVAAPASLIREMQKLYSIMDRQGDVLGELALGEMIADGEMHRYLKQSTLEYRRRRDQLSTLLVTRLGDRIDFRVPDGGLAIWTRWPENFNLLRYSRECAAQGLHIPHYLLYQSQSIAGIRMGFGSLSLPDIETVVNIMASVR